MSACLHSMLKRNVSKKVGLDRVDGTKEFSLVVEAVAH